jgi:hypothetical protein
VPEWKFDHFPDLSHLLATATNVIITYVVEFLFIFSLDWFAFGVEDSLGANNADFSWFSSNNLEFDSFEIASDNEVVSFFDWSIGVLEVGNQVSLS